MDTMSLEELFNKAFSDESLQSKFYYELLMNEVYILGEPCGSIGGALADGCELNVVGLRSDGDVYVPIFLSKESMLHFLEGHKQQYVCDNGADLLETVKQTNIVINPGQENSMVLYPSEIQAILSQGKN